MAHEKKVLICPLPWGLGHATRCIPIAKELTANGFIVYFAVNSQLQILLQSELPRVKCIPFPACSISYSKNKRLLITLGFQLPKLVVGYIMERRKINYLVKNEGISFVISDNRYGCYSRKTYNIFLTHQLSPHLPASLRWIKPFLNKLLFQLIKPFNKCWIPDDLNLHLSGNLSKNAPGIKSVKFIGLLSRFDSIISYPVAEIPDISWLAIISGPEPQRSIFEAVIHKKFNETDKTCVIIRGKPIENNQFIKTNKVWMISHLPSPQLKYLMESSLYIVCRSGYSSVMDLITLNRTALLIPTPGQTEQEYLATHLSARQLFVQQFQDKINLVEAKNEIAKVNWNFDLHKTDLTSMLPVLKGQQK